jgi:hypothetical protein
MTLALNIRLDSNEAGTFRGSQDAFIRAYFM